MSKELINYLTRRTASEEEQKAADLIESLQHKLDTALAEITTQDQRFSEVLRNLNAEHEAQAAQIALLRGAIQTEIDLYSNESDTDHLLEALSIQPDDSALMAWLGEPVACSSRFGQIMWIECGKDAPPGATLFYAPKRIGRCS